MSDIFPILRPGREQDGKGYQPKGGYTEPAGEGAASIQRAKNRQRGKQYPGTAGLGMYRPGYSRFRGHADGFAYLKKIGAFKTEKPMKRCGVIRAVFT